MSKSHRDPVREQFWRQTIAAWHASGQTIRDFCQQRQLKKTAFDYWRGELQRRDSALSPLASTTATSARAKPVSKRKTPNSPTFVPVTIVDSPGPKPVPASAVIEVRCPSGHVVQVPASDVTMLCHLFTALARAEVAPC